MRLDRQQVADRRRSRRARPRRARRRRRAAAAPCVLAASSRPRCPVAAFAQPELASTTRSASSRQRSRLTSTGAAGVPVRGEARGARRARSASQTSSPRSGLPLGLIPHGDAGRAEARRAARRRRRARARAPAPAPSASGRTASRSRSQQPRVSGRPNIRLRFCTACEEVPFQRLSIAENTSTLPVCSSVAANSRQKFVSRTSRTPGGASTTSTNGSSA